MGLKGTDKINVQAWIDDLTYAEVHAFLWAFGLTTGGAFALPSNPRLGASGFAAAFSLLVGALTDYEPTRIKVPSFVTEQIRYELHYYVGGLIIGSVLGYAARLVV